MTTDIVSRVDHLVYATPSLARGISEVEELLGVAATPGGVHPGRGTRNALLSLGESTYLEIIGPDLEQPEPLAPRPFGIDSLERAGLVTWAMRAPDIERRLAAARARGYDPGEIFEMSRDTPGGERLEWRLTRPTESLGGAGALLVPFLIDWGDTRHPAAAAVAGGRLLDLRAGHPRPSEVAAALAALDLPLIVEKGDAATIEARIDCSRGIVTLS